MTMAGNYQIREGRISDCDTLAYMINQASEGAVDYLLGHIKPQRSPLELLSQQLTSQVHYSYANALVAELDDKVLAAMVLSFPADGLILDENVLAGYSSAQQQYLRYFSDNRIPDSWHLDAIFVAAAQRNTGLGQLLLSAVKRCAKQYNFPLIQVFVFASNVGAVRFYQRHGFEVDKHIAVEGHEFMHDKRSLLRMRCEL